MTLLTFAISRWEKYNFLLAELVKRDFKKKYKRTILGVLWSLLHPLLSLLVMTVIFVHFFGNRTQNFTIYIFAGQLVFGFFSESTNGGMSSLMGNSGLIKTIKVPKYLFLFSKNASSVIEFFITLLAFFVFVAMASIPFNLNFFMLLYPIITLMVFNIGVGLILSAFFVFFKDTQYLYSVFTRMVMFLSAIFYPIDTFPHRIQQLFFLNPVFVHIQYFRLVVLHGTTPSINLHLILGVYALAALAIGSYIYKRYNYKFVYYM